MAYAHEVAMLEDSVLTSWIVDELLTAENCKNLPSGTCHSLKTTCSGSTTKSVCTGAIKSAVDVLATAASAADIITSTIDTAADIITSTSDTAEAAYCSLPGVIWCRRRRLLSYSNPAEVNPMAGVSDVTSTFTHVQAKKAQQNAELQKWMGSKEKTYFSQRKPAFLPSELVPMLESGVSAAFCQAQFKPKSQNYQDICPMPTGEALKTTKSFCKMYPSWISYWAKQW
jgi:hypothetical protein